MEESTLTAGLRGGWLAVWMTVAAVLVPAAALGQGSPILPETRPILAGPVTFYPTIALRDAGVDSNVFNDPTGPRGDFTYSVTPRLFVVAPIANTRFIGRGLGTLTYYRTYKDQQSLSGLFDGRYEVVSPGFRPFASIGFADRRERRGFEIDARVRQRQTLASIGLDVDVTAITALTAWASRTRTSWDENARYLSVDLADQLDYSATSFAVGARVRVTPLTTVVFAAEVQQDRFDRSPLRDADSFRIGPSVDFDSSAAITGHLKADYRSFRPRNPAIASYQGLTAFADLRYVFRDRIELTIDANRDVDYSYDPNGPYFLEVGGRFTLTQRIVGPFGVVAIGERRDIQHQRLGAPSFTGRREITRGVGAGLVIQKSKQLRFELVYERMSRTSSEAGWRAYERQRVFASAIYGQ
jgi:hypothetical protein